MVRILERVWVRFGIYMTLIVLVTATIAGASILSIRTESWEQEGHNLLTEIVVVLSLSIFFGTAAAFLAARVFARPLNSVIQAAVRIAQGDLTVRAQPLIGNDELATMIKNFNSMADSLERLERERKTTVAVMSHELRTPLTILQGRLHALCDGVIVANASEHKRLLEHTEHLARLVEDLHTLSLVEAGRLSLHCKHVELGAFVQEIMPFYLHRADSYGVKIELETTAVFINADRDRLRQIFANLIENTLHYAASGGLLKIKVQPSGEYAILELSDRGSGLADGDIQWVFNPFFRGDSTAVQTRTGSGLGLSIVQSLITQHNGSITASNNPEGGACFEIKFPAVSFNE